MGKIQVYEQEIEGKCVGETNTLSQSRVRQLVGLGHPSLVKLNDRHSSLMPLTFCWKI